MNVMKVVLVAMLVCGQALAADQAGLLIDTTADDQERAALADLAAALHTPDRIGNAVFSSPDLKKYYMGADIGSAYKAAHYKTNVKGWRGKLWQGVKAPFVAVGQTGLAIARIPGATLANAKADPAEAAGQLVTALVAVGSQSDWFGLDKDNSRPRAGGSFETTPEGAKGDFRGVTGSVQVTTKKTVVTPDGSEVSETTITFNQIKD